MFKKWKAHFWSFFHFLQNERHTFEAVCMFTKWKTGFWSVFRLYKMKTCFLYWNFVYWKKKTITLQKHVRSCIGISFCKCKKHFKNVFFILWVLKTAYKTCFFIFVKTKDASKLLWFLLQKQRTLQKCVFHF